jgi:hypothetical protein
MLGYLNLAEPSRTHVDAQTAPQLLQKQKSIKIMVIKGVALLDSMYNKNKIIPQVAA